MHQLILSFSNARFYEGKLLSDPKAGEHLLRNDTEPLIFIDTAGCGFDEEHDEEPKVIKTTANIRSSKNIFFSNLKNIWGHPSVS
jgi:superfamily I DNA and/or RNA helicase